MKKCGASSIKHFGKQWEGAINGRVNILGCNAQRFRRLGNQIGELAENRRFFDMLKGQE